MKTLRFTSGLLLASFFLLVNCHRQEVDPDDSPNVRALRTAEIQTVKNSTGFAFNAFRQLNSSEPTEQNQFISPFSIAMAVAMTYNGADGTTKEGIRKALNLDGLSDEEMNSAFQSLSEYLNNIDKTVAFMPANSIWYRKNLTPQVNFVETNRNYFNAEVNGLDFLGDAEGSKNTINGWVKNKTKDKIDKIIDNITSEHVMFLINAIYFKGTWAYKFDKNLTKPADFHLENGSVVSKDFMTGKVKADYYTDGDKVLVDLPYGNKQFTMTLLMPQPGKPMESLVSQLNSENFANWMEKADTGTITVSLPKFKFEGNYTKGEFNRILAGLGMAEAFTDKADFSRLLVGFKEGDLKINEVGHKTFVQVDEEGTEAAAVTSIGIGTTSIGPAPAVFDRPFIYLIRERNSGAILFMGKMMNPTLEK